MIEKKTNGEPKKKVPRPNPDKCGVEKKNETAGRVKKKLQ